MSENDFTWPPVEVDEPVRLATRFSFVERRVLQPRESFEMTIRDGLVKRCSVRYERIVLIEGNGLVFLRELIVGPRYVVKGGRSTCVFPLTVNHSEGFQIIAKLENLGETPAVASLEISGVHVC